MTVPVWAQWSLRIPGWAPWQLFVLLFAFVVYANAFSEYGVYTHPVVDPLAAIAFLLLALFLGTFPIRRWRNRR